MQRTLDILLSAMALLILSPLLIPITLILLATGEHEVFYFQSRIGQHGKTFRLYKFATMLKNSPSIGSGTVTLKHDPRILPAGRFLRKTKINELPQLLNILKGDMSVIGPRPMTQQTFSAYTPEIQATIVKVRPGLSGIGSIIFRAEEDLLEGETATVDFYNQVIAPYKGQLEDWYVNNRSAYVYLASIFITAWVVLRPASPVVWKAFPTLPQPPARLRIALGCG